MKHLSRFAACLLALTLTACTAAETAVPAATAPRHQSDISNLNIGIMQECKCGLADDICIYPPDSSQNH